MEARWGILLAGDRKYKNGQMRLSWVPTLFCHQPGRRRRKGAYQLAEKRR